MFQIMKFIVYLNQSVFFLNFLISALSQYYKIYLDVQSCNHYKHIHVNEVLCPHHSLPSRMVTADFSQFLLYHF